MVWTIGDLLGSSCTVLLFGKAFESYWKLNETSVIAIANADNANNQRNNNNNNHNTNHTGGLSNIKSTPQSSGVCLSLRFQGQVLHIGTSKDMGYCAAYKNEVGKQHVKSLIKCKNVINTYANMETVFASHVHQSRIHSSNISSIVSHYVLLLLLSRFLLFCFPLTPFFTARKVNIVNII